MSKLILGVATNSKGRYKATIDGKMTKSHATWKNMLQRAYCPKYHAEKPTYVGCSVTDDWLEYQEFAYWFSNHEYSNRGYELDKDLLIPGNKIYAPNTVCFIPAQLNNLLADNGAVRGQYKQGVCFYKQWNKFRARININGKRKHLGYYDNELDAHLAYKKAKGQYIKDSANHWQDDIATDVYNALINWQLEDTK